MSAFRERTKNSSYWITNLRTKSGENQKYYFTIYREGEYYTDACAKIWLAGNDKPLRFSSDNMVFMMNNDRWDWCQQKPERRRDINIEMKELDKLISMRFPEILYLASIDENKFSEFANRFNKKYSLERMASCGGGYRLSGEEMYTREQYYIDNKPANLKDCPTDSFIWKEIAKL